MTQPWKFVTVNQNSKLCTLKVIIFNSFEKMFLMIGLVFLEVFFFFLRLLLGFESQSFWSVLPLCTFGSSDFASCAQRSY